MRTRRCLGPAGHLALFFWCLATVFLVGAPRIPRAALLVIMVLGLTYPAALRRALKPGWLLLIIAMSLPSLFFGGDPVVVVGPFELSGAGFQMALATALRALVILIALESLTSTFDIILLASFFERAGLKGMGFALGVALNLLPILRRAAAMTWYALRMRGGLGRQPLRGLRFYLTTVACSAVQRADDISLAAEARGYIPGQLPPPALRPTMFDKMTFIAGGAMFLLLACL